MSMEQVVRTIQQIARHEAERTATVALGVVRSVHGANGEQSYACTVELRDSGIVLPRTPIATGLIGAVALPREGDLVVVAFVAGDLHGPVVVGRLYNEEVSPPAHEPGEVVIALPGDEVQADKKLEIRIVTPGDGSRNAKLTLDGSVKVEIEVGDESIRLQTQDASFELSQSGGSDGKAELKVGDSKVVLEQSGNVSVEAAANLTLKANKIEISGDTEVKVAGTTVSLN
jgi:uncharacterized protein involved in type VI secretion and phage assembly